MGIPKLRHFLVTFKLGNLFIFVYFCLERGFSPSDLHVQFIQAQGQKLVVLDKAVAFFIPEHVPDPSRRPAGEELWVEVTIPKKGPPRPIRLGVKKVGGPIVSLQLK